MRLEAALEPARGAVMTDKLRLGLNSTFRWQSPLTGSSS
jgi:hypothetical protein